MRCVGATLIYTEQRITIIIVLIISKRPSSLVPRPHTIVHSWERPGDEANDCVSVCVCEQTNLHLPLSLTTKVSDVVPPTDVTQTAGQRAKVNKNTTYVSVLFLS